VAKGIVILPKSVTPSRIESNYKGAMEVASKLSKEPEKLDKLDGIAAGNAERKGAQKRFIKPPWGVPMGFIDWN